MHSELRTGAPIFGAAGAYLGTGCELLAEDTLSLKSAAASVESVRLDPELREALVQRARKDHQTPSSVIREALRKYLHFA
jgi:hypothetical protein